jgi:hypothetical protein
VKPDNMPTQPTWKNRLFRWTNAIVISAASIAALAYLSSGALALPLDNPLGPDSVGTLLSFAGPTRRVAESNAIEKGNQAASADQGILLDEWRYTGIPPLTTGK